MEWCVAINNSRPFSMSSIHTKNCLSNTSIDCNRFEVQTSLNEKQFGKYLKIIKSDID